MGGCSRSVDNAVVKALQKEGYKVAQFEHRYILQDADHGGVELSGDGEEQLEDFLQTASSRTKFFGQTLNGQTTLLFQPIGLF